MLGYVIIFLLVIIIVYFIITFNSFIKLDNIVKEAFSTMDVYLKKRWDLIPNIVECVKEYSNYEKESLKEIINLRNNTYDTLSTSEKIDINEKVSSNINNIIALKEEYPVLKANENFMDLHNQLVKIEDEIANSRKYYNGTVRIFNNKVQMFPSNIISFILRFKEKKMFEINSQERNNIKIGELYEKDK